MTNLVKYISFLTILLCILIHIGCATTSQITPKISVGMTKAEVIEICGNPYRAAAKFDSKIQKTVEVLTYKETTYSTPLGPLVSTNESRAIDDVVKIHFIDNKVVQYGTNLDWVTVADIEGERKIKITTDENITINNN